MFNNMFGGRKGFLVGIYKFTLNILQLQTTIYKIIITMYFVQ